MSSDSESRWRVACSSYRQVVGPRSQFLLETKRGAFRIGKYRLDQDAILQKQEFGICNLNTSPIK